mmetsp:Transcript_16784/g.63864  ORF Transcript_16784/g.63864 Transcript_16784/m.63864 type:complete len:222 (-) Transcript_16784:190-855(-)
MLCTGKSEVIVTRSQLLTSALHRFQARRQVVDQIRRLFNKPPVTHGPPEISQVRRRTLRDRETIVTAIAYACDFLGIRRRTFDYEEILREGSYREAAAVSYREVTSTRTVQHGWRTLGEVIHEELLFVAEKHGLSCKDLEVCKIRDQLVEKIRDDAVEYEDPVALAGGWPCHVVTHTKAGKILMKSTKVQLEARARLLGLILTSPCPKIAIAFKVLHAEGS